MVALLARARYWQHALALDLLEGSRTECRGRPVNAIAFAVVSSNVVATRSCPNAKMGASSTTTPCSPA